MAAQSWLRDSRDGPSLLQEKPSWEADCSNLGSIPGFLPSCLSPGSVHCPQMLHQNVSCKGPCHRLTCREPEVGRGGGGGNAGRGAESLLAIRARLIFPPSGTPTILASVSGEEEVIESRTEMRGRRGERESREAFRRQSLQKIAKAGDEKRLLFLNMLIFLCFSSPSG